ncbi:hypothetical protein [Sulfuracidifex metallicus]|uniref:hypothetical protein n=1 Tax=Sulfuracidifex metallicus TaxID=47303 RepID=UPI0022752169|nr:hypothetical protein [Sulfuracidifex metallicus]MCY0849342.1 hypothetical protein [Sulfuracidifex metallicus]
MKVLLLFIAILVLVFPLMTLGVSPSTYLYTVNIADGQSLTAYSYNYTVTSSTFTSYILTISLPNGTQIYSKSLIDGSSCFPNFIPFSGHNVSIRYVGQVEIEGNQYKEFKGTTEIYNQTIPISAYFLNGVLFKLNGTYNHMTLNMVNVEPPQSTPSNTLEYIPIIVVFAVIIIGIAVMIKLGKI